MEMAHFAAWWDPVKAQAMGDCGRMAMAAAAAIAVTMATAIVVPKFYASAHGHGQQVPKYHTSGYRNSLQGFQPL